MTVRALVHAMQTEIRDQELTPARSCELLAKLTALIGNCNDELRHADLAYKPVLLRHLEGTEAANRARIRAECSPEYARCREAKDTRELVVEMVRSLKKLIAAQQDEMRLSR